jgi:hypothetical protein
MTRNRGNSLKRFEEYSVMKVSRVGCEETVVMLHSSVRVSTCARTVSSSVLLVTGSTIVAQRSSCGSLGAREAPPSSVPGRSASPMEAFSGRAAARAWDSVYWYSWMARHRWNDPRASSRSEKESGPGFEPESVVVSTMLVRIWAVLLNWSVRISCVRKGRGFYV